MSPRMRKAIVSETDRLVLRRLELEDAPFIVELLNEPSFLQHIGDKGVRGREDAHRYLREGPLASYEKNGFGLFLVLSRQTGEPLGICGLIQRESLPEPDLGYAFVPRSWGQGYAFEAASATIELGRDDYGLRRILAVVTPENRPSIRLLEKLGLEREGRVRLPGDDTELELFAWAPPAR